MLPLLPYKQLVFESPLSKDETLRRLTLEVARQRRGLDWFERRTEKFEGVLTDEGFTISPIIRYRNSFRPVIKGRFYPLVRGVRIDVTMRLHISVLIISILWIGAFSLG